ncbi:hypothetical protein L9W92_11960 [Pelotomaculum terephthalicicum JT]|uniref:hypothetical protein n=1 Tax=Pelotomaculum TaxID=191373 RepID=UPI0009C8CE05|nr:MULTISPECIES: hypothetical protein [Pelotomaculum]MCG9968755.1 hypothetical protein [Pelotomaculum terephthalicicum JT]OPX84613.1 MAG: hypothetical protein A4E54_02798 [Pelotomaculum sp. PtaB.Bin117]OPY63344.1 MAG: hypothetical protein A4E56_00694 [Pelotomaculum sp. PtaU1.Bin065]
MSSSVPNASKIFKIDVGGDMIGLAGVERAFLEVLKLGLKGDQASKKLLEIVGRTNYIPKSAERQYEWALYLAYRNYIADPSTVKKAMEFDQSLVC